MTLTENYLHRLPVTVVRFYFGLFFYLLTLLIPCLLMVMPALKNNFLTVQHSLLTGIDL